METMTKTALGLIVAGLVVSFVALRDASTYGYVMSGVGTVMILVGLFLPSRKDEQQEEFNKKLRQCRSEKEDGE